MCGGAAQVAAANEEGDAEMTAEERAKRERRDQPANNDIVCGRDGDRRGVLSYQVTTLRYLNRQGL